MKYLKYSILPIFLVFFLFPRTAQSINSTRYEFDDFTVEIPASLRVMTKSTRLKGDVSFYTVLPDTKPKYLKMNFDEIYKKFSELKYRKLLAFDKGGDYIIAIDISNISNSELTQGVWKYEKIYKSDLKRNAIAASTVYGDKKIVISLTSFSFLTILSSHEEVMQGIVDSFAPYAKHPIELSETSALSIILIVFGIAVAATFSLDKIQKLYRMIREAHERKLRKEQQRKESEEKVKRERAANEKNARDEQQKRAYEEQARRERGETESNAKKHMSKFKKYFDILELPITATILDVEKQRKVLLQIYHPDKNQANESVKKFAEKKSKEVNDAFEQLKIYFNAC